MKKTFNESHYPELFAAAIEKGSGVGAYVATMGWVKADITLARAATGYVNKLPLNNLRLEEELHSAFITAALKAVEASATEVK